MEKIGYIMYQIYSNKKISKNTHTHMDTTLENKLLRYRRPSADAEDKYHLCFSSRADNPEEVEQWFLHWLPHPEGGAKLEDNIQLQEKHSVRYVGVMFDMRDFESFRERAVEFTLKPEGLAQVQTGPSRRAQLESEKREKRHAFLMQHYRDSEHEAFDKVMREKILPNILAPSKDLEAEDLAAVIDALSREPHASSPEAQKLVEDAKNLRQLLISE